MAGVGVLRALPRHRPAASERRKAGSGEQPHELFDTPFYARFRAWSNWCVRHRWITIGATVAIARARRGRHGRGAAAVLPRFEPARDPGRPVDAGRHDVRRRTRRWRKRFEARMMQELEGVEDVTTWVGSGVPSASTCRSTRSSRRRNVSQMIVLPQRPEGARGAAHSACRRCWPTEFPEVRGRVKLLPNGPPVPYPVQFRVVGPERRRSAPRPTRSRRSCAPTRTCAASTTTGTSRSRRCSSTIDQDKARALGVTSQAIAQASRTDQLAAPRSASTARATS